MWCKDTQAEWSYVKAINSNWTIAPDSADDSRRNIDSTNGSQTSSDNADGADGLATKHSELKRQFRAVTNKNQQLETECAQLKRLLKDYEIGLESATSSMRLQVVRDIYAIQTAVYGMTERYSHILVEFTQRCSIKTTARIWQSSDSGTSKILPAMQRIFMYSQN